MSKVTLCFNCRKWGHISAACPDRDLPYPTHPTSQPTVTRLPSLFTMGTIGEAPVHFFLDSGADLTVINKQTLNELHYSGMTTPSQQSDVTINGVRRPPCRSYIWTARSWDEYLHYLWPSPMTSVMMSSWTEIAIYSMHSWRLQSRISLKMY